MWKDEIKTRRKHGQWKIDYQIENHFYISSNTSTEPSTIFGKSLGPHLMIFILNDNM